MYSKPEFTALPPFIFTGAEFALIPSRDEPFGLVAVEFGRKGALGVGARVGGLGQMVSELSQVKQLRQNANTYSLVGGSPWKVQLPLICSDSSSRQSRRHLNRRQPTEL